MNYEIGFQKKKIKRIKKKFCSREGIGEYLKELEKKLYSLMEQEKQEKKRYTKKLKKA